MHAKLSVLEMTLTGNANAVLCLFPCFLNRKLSQRHIDMKVISLCRHIDVIDTMVCARTQLLRPANQG